MSDKEKDFVRKRWMFFGVVATGVFGWSLGTGLISLPGFGNSVNFEGEGEIVEEWEEGEEGELEEGAEYVR